MESPISLLTAIGRAVVTAVAEHSPNEIAVQADAALAEAVWLDWRQAADDVRRADAAEMASLSPEQAAIAATGIAHAVASGLRAEAVNAVSRYLRHVPSFVRRTLRRPADPSGKSVPPTWKVRNAQDLLPLLPPRLPWFEIGDRPFGIGDWELLELANLGDWGEEWKARDPHKPDKAAVTLHFAFHPSIKEKVRVQNAAEWERIRALTAQAGWVTLQQVHQQADPPCLQWDHDNACDLFGLVAQWNEEERKPPRREAAALIRELAGILTAAHQLQPPLVHRAINPGNIHVAAGLECKIANAGLGDLLDPGIGSSWMINPAAYISPQQQRGDPAQPRDDVFALGVLWYQLLMADLATGRPDGLQWRKRLMDGAIPQDQVELLESCLEDDPRNRPADAGVLAKKMAEMLGPKSQIPSPKPELSSAAIGPRTANVAAAAPRPAAKKGSVWGLLEGLGEKVQEQAKFFTNSLGVKLTLIPAGTFLMGSPLAELGRRDNEGPQHEVQLPNPFYMAVHTVTQGQFQRLMERSPAKFDIAHGGGMDHPVENVTWEEAAEFCRRLSDQPEEKSAKRRYRLPTEAEWEYACRSGAATPFSFGPALSSEQANFDGNFPYGGAARGLFAEKTVPVGSYTANNYSLCEMHGNVWEWCADWLHSDYYGVSPKRNPQGPGGGVFRVLRGGCWRCQAVTCRSAYRNGLSPKSRDRCTGFRVVAEVG